MTSTSKTFLGMAAAAMLLIAGAVAEVENEHENEHGGRRQQARTSAADVGKLPPAANQLGVTFAKDIKPLFADSCVSCHGPDKQKGDIRLDSLEGVLKGGKDGKIVVVGDSAKSQLTEAVARIDRDTAMPRPAKRGGPVTALTADQVGLIRAWIDQGAK